LNRKQLEAVLLLARIEPISIHEIPNEYHRESSNPWFYVLTKDGILKIGLRSRVVELDYSLTCKRGELTDSDVTKSNTMVHAWTDGDLVNYLINWGRLPWSEDFSRKVGEGKTMIGEYFDTYAGPQLNSDPVVKAVLENMNEHDSDLTKMIDPLTKEETMVLWTGRNQISFTFPKTPA